MTLLPRFESGSDVEKWFWSFAVGINGEQSSIDVEKWFWSFFAVVINGEQSSIAVMLRDRRFETSLHRLNAA